MATENPDEFDTELQQLFAESVPDAGFEQRIVNAVRVQRRWSIPMPIRRAAIAAAAVLVLGSAGYYGNLAISGRLGVSLARSRSISAASNLHQAGLASIMYRGDRQAYPDEVWDFGGGSNTAQNWVNWNGFTGVTNNLSYSYSNPFASKDANSKGVQLKNPDGTFAIAGDINGDETRDAKAGKPPVSRQPSSYNNQDSILLPYAGDYGGDDKNEKTVQNEKRGQSPFPIPETMTIASSGGKVDGQNILTGNVSGLNYFHGNTNGIFDRNPGQATAVVDATGKGQDAINSILSDDKTVALRTSESTNQKGGQSAPSNSKLPQAEASFDPAKFKDVDGDGRSDESLGGRAGEAGKQGPPPSSAASPTTQPAIDTRKIIRSGTMEFEVDRFDSAQANITKIVGELGGFVGATESTKLPNGKVRGSIALRIPPERLDNLVLSLRALGDLKSQQITAADITKQYTDLESELTADRAMQDRLLELIHNGKGSVKDLLAAENELGTWRGKIEKIEGELRYDDSLVAMSTLTITLSERDIQTPATAIETETADMGIEAEDVEKARNTAMKAIDDAHGRIVAAELKRFDAGQLAAQITADVPPDASGGLIDQLKMLGKVARLEVHRQETTSNGSTPVVSMTTTQSQELTDLRKSHQAQLDEMDRAIAAISAQSPNADTAAAKAKMDDMALEFAKQEAKLEKRLVIGANHTERKPTRLLISIYNLANVAPRQTTNVNLAATDVEAAFGTLVALTKTTGGRVVTSNLDRGDPVKATGAMALEIPPEKLDAAMAALHAQGEVLKLTLTENADTQNSTDAKHGLTVQLVSLASVPARESVQQTIAAVNVPTAYQAILTAAGNVKARTLTAQLNEQDPHNISADVQLEVLRGDLPAMDKALAAVGDTVGRTSNRAADADGTVDSKVLVKLSIGSADHLAPRETTRLQSEVTDIDKAAADAQAIAVSLAGHVLDATITNDHGKGTARVAIDVPLDKSQEALRQIRSLGNIRGIDASRDTQAPTGPLAHAQIFVEFATGDVLVTDDTGPLASVRHGLSTSITALLWSLQWVVVGICLIGPFAAVAWIISRIWRKFRPSSRAANV